METNPPSEESQAVEPTQQKGSRWPYVAIAIMLVLFAIVLTQRNRIRAVWWSHQLTQTTDLNEKAYYVGSLAAVGEAAKGSLDRLLRHPNATTRSLGIAVLQTSPKPWAIQLLASALNDADIDVRESAAITLAMMHTDEAVEALRLGLRASENESCAAAVYGLARSGGNEATEALCRVLAEHSAPAVRAQAAESLADLLMVQPLASTVVDDRPWISLIGALTDRGGFSGQLAIEREIADMAAFASAHRGPRFTNHAISVQDLSTRTVADVAARGLSMLTGEEVRPLEQPPTHPAALAERFRRLHAERKRLVPSTPPPSTQEKPASSPDTSSDKATDPQ